MTYPAGRMIRPAAFARPPHASIATPVFEVSDYKLTDLLSSAGGAIGIIIAGVVFLPFVSSKYVELAGRYREMADEYRGRESDEPRHGPLRRQTRVYHRLRLLNRASWLGAAVMFVHEMILTRVEIGEAVADLDDEAKRPTA